MQIQKIENVPVDQIQMHQMVPNVRTKIRKSDCEDLMRSIKEHGIQNPLTAFSWDGKLFLVSGERRLSSMRWLNEENPKEEKYKTVPVIVQDYTEGEKDQDLALRKTIDKAIYVNLLENIQRSDLNPLDLANRIKFLVDNGVPKPEICKQLGKSITWLNETINCLDALPVVHEQVRAGNITLDEARKISKLQPAAQERVTVELSAAKAIGDRAGKKKIKRNLRAEVSAGGVLPPGKKELTAACNATTEILRAMKEAKEHESKSYFHLTGFLNGVRCSMGETDLPDFEKMAAKYKISLDKKGNREQSDE